MRKPTSTFKDPNTFRFGSPIFIGQLKAIGSNESSKINSLKFEIQIKSAFEHAWSVTTHDLTYKSSEIDWKLLRLAASLKSSVEQLDMIILTAKEASKNIPEHKWPEIMIKKRLLTFYKGLFERNILPEELTPKDFNRAISSIFNLIKSKLNIWNERKWKKSLSNILKELEEGLIKLNSPSFPISLSMYQSSLGILLDKKIIDTDELKNNSILLPELFKMVFPKVKINDIKEFTI